MSEEPTIQILKDGPLIVSEAVEISDASGKKIDASGKVALCRCGASSNKPLCDGTHKKIDFTDAAG